MTLTYELLLLWLFPFSGLFQDNLCKPVPERYNTIQYNTKFVKRHVAVASEAQRRCTPGKM